MSFHLVCFFYLNRLISFLSLQKYKHKESARSDIEAATRAYPSLPVKYQSFTFDDGTTSDLLSLDGTLPVTYDGHTYNIPVAVFFLAAHPHLPPMVYVRPTSSMEIKKGKNVDNSGRVYLPYISSWKHPQSNTVQLLHLLRQVFSQNPPVFAKQPARPPPPTGHAGQPSVGFQAYPPTQGSVGSELGGTDKNGLPVYTCHARASSPKYMRARLHRVSLRSALVPSYAYAAHNVA
ncbi:unnamed protein product [Dibothriocephalus latus]|uniref:UEV domain-containing protein n=1 Tax=Dibothriocephalus latus TaxID=60516 RepID=A0A3P7NMR2_DIBLA|nr:unnamed protein product [Dibothriocephalus latus]